MKDGGRDRQDFKESGRGGGGGGDTSSAPRPTLPSLRGPNPAMNIAAVIAYVTVYADPSPPCRLPDASLLGKPF